jgi:hypothetical protein
MTYYTVTLQTKYSKYDVNIPSIPELAMPILNTIQNPYCCVTHLMNQGGPYTISGVANILGGGGKEKIHDIIKQTHI